jgi:hypothetical protein
MEKAKTNTKTKKLARVRKLAAKKLEKKVTLTNVGDASMITGATMNNWQSTIGVSKG